eukprot:g2277.t1
MDQDDDEPTAIKVKTIKKKRKKGKGTKRVLEELHLLKVPKHLFDFLEKQDNNTFVGDLVPGAQLRFYTESSLIEGHEDVAASYDIHWNKKEKAKKKRSNGASGGKTVHRMVFTDHYEKEPVIEGVVGRDGYLVRDRRDNKRIRWQNKQRNDKARKMEGSVLEMMSGVDRPVLDVEVKEVKKAAKVNVYTRLSDKDLRTKILEQFDKTSAFTLKLLMKKVPGQGGEGRFKSILKDIADYKKGGDNARKWVLNDIYRPKGP